MARDLLSSKKRRGNTSSKAPFQQTPQQPMPDQLEGIDMGQVNNVVDSMKGKSEKEMQDELFKVANEQFKTGTLKPDDLDNFARQASSMLNDEQRKKLNMLTGMLKNQARNN